MRALGAEAKTGNAVAEVCAYCHWCRENEVKQPECWHEPPSVIGEPVFSPPIVGGGPQKINWMVNGVRAPTRPGWSCAYFEPRSSVVN